MAQIPNDEPALLLVECEENEKLNMLTKEERMTPNLNQDDKRK